MSSAHLTIAVIVVGAVSVLNLLLFLTVLVARRNARTERPSRGLVFPDTQLDLSEVRLPFAGSNEALTWLEESKAVALAFLSPQCEPCKDQVLALSRVRQKYRPKGIELALVIPATDSVATEFLGAVAPLHDVISGEHEAQQLFRVFEVTSTPSFAVMTPDGRVRVTGHTHLLSSALDAVLSGNV